MKYKKAALINAIAAVCAPVVTVAIMLIFEKEVVEAVLGGLFFGCILGAIFGIVALVLNRGYRRKIVTMLSVIPVIPIVVYLVLLIPFLFHDENYNTSEPTEVVSGQQLSDEEIRNIYAEA